VYFFFIIIKKGLSQQYAQEKLLQDGPNALKPMKGEPEWKKFLGKLFGGFHLLLLFGAFLCMAAFFMEYSTSDQPSYDNVHLSAALVGMRCNSLNATNFFFVFFFVFSCFQLWLSIILIILVIGTTIFAYYQERQSSNIMDSFKGMIPQVNVVYYCIKV
jgi:magnesium-transporting ATPase (P-type)